MNTAQWMRGSLFLRMEAMSAATSWRLASAVTACFMLLVLPRSSLFLFSALWMILSSSATDTLRL